MTSGKILVLVGEVLGVRRRIGRQSFVVLITKLVKNDMRIVILFMHV